MTAESQKTQARQFTAPRGTRDFYPGDMAVRRYIEGAWRQISINHGFDEIDGPTFEHLDLYTHKSGPGIAAELFQVLSGKDEEQIAAIRDGQTAPYALRPEFTPTLARMVAAKAAELPRPIKWFAIPSHFRAERPQRGRLREFMQWNVDFIGEASANADADVIITAVGALERLGLRPEHVQVKISDRAAAAAFLQSHGVANERLTEAFDFIDKHDRYAPEKREARRRELGIDEFAMSAFEPGLVSLPFAAAPQVGGQRPEIAAFVKAVDQFIGPLRDALQAAGAAEWCRYDNGIVRGLAYYTGTVFEIHEVTGEERAIAGGGRYDKLIENFGGPSLPACGFGMGDVVLGNLLRDKGLLPEEVYLKPLQPDAFVIAASDEAAARLPSIVARLRREALHVRHSYKSTRNVGKLLGDASKSRARFAVILGNELAEEKVMLKDLQGGNQFEMPLAGLAEAIRSASSAE